MARYQLSAVAASVIIKSGLDFLTELKMTGIYNKATLILVFLYFDHSSQQFQNPISFQYILWLPCRTTIKIHNYLPLFL